MYTTTLTHAHTNALSTCTCTVCIYVRLQIIVDKIRRQYLQSPFPLYKPPTDYGCGGCLSDGSMACTLTCVHCGQLSEVTRPHPCVLCGGITSNTLEAFLYYENSNCLSCYTGAEALHIRNEVCKQSIRLCKSIMAKFSPKA